MSQFSHFNEQGRAKMVDISDKSSTVRTAVAVSSVRMIKEVFHKIEQREIGKGMCCLLHRLLASWQQSKHLPSFQCVIRLH